MFALITALISGVLLVGFAVLCTIESRRGRRVILPNVRARLDAWTVALMARFMKMQMHAGTGTARMTIHYLIHDMLRRLLRFSERFGDYLERMLHRNRGVVRSVRNVRNRSHLDLIAEHKASSALGESERKDMKQRSIEGDD